MDGRAQLPVIQWLRQNLGVEYVDMITEPGPVRILAEAPESSPAKSILGRVAVSVEKHGSRRIAVVAHHDCAGNPVDKEQQLVQLRRAIETVTSWRLPAEVIGLWVDENWQVTKTS